MIKIFIKNIYALNNFIPLSIEKHIKVIYTEIQHYIINKIKQNHYLIPFKYLFISLMEKKYLDEFMQFICVNNTNKDYKLVVYNVSKLNRSHLFYILNRYVDYYSFFYLKHINKDNVSSDILLKVFENIKGERDAYYLFAYLNSLGIRSKICLKK